MNRRLSFVFAAPLALTLASCGDSAQEADETALEGEAIADIAAPDGQSWLETASETEEGGFVIGNPEAPLKLVEYASHTCGACAYFAENGSAPLQENYVQSGVVSYEIRPLLRDPLDVTISTLARCGSPEGFHALADQAWASLSEFGDTLQSNGTAYEAAMSAPPEQRFVQLAQAAGLIDFFAARGISADQARTCLADGDAINAMAEKSSEVAAANNVTGTPTFFLNGQRLDVNQWQALEPILQRAGAR
ncbi:thioredoxin domain-containing protein [Qipengyuania huizhouensis]|uniref:thioredoxin domain-containing protein n=1 Tax=Qipengyuania huizhouensis TaxID=2867245 RepID=UPI00185C37DB|nr:thioredoxin domain-containing protein [Qipengyuania huizhouensis]MBA4765809.1 thioredoxin domain-containing protein [Erythrobacter sp.]MBX7461845.1 DsbA family protein [Qipengyuania huizhouensis]